MMGRFEPCLPALPFERSNVGQQSDTTAFNGHVIGLLLNSLVSEWEVTSLERFGMPCYWGSDVSIAFRKVRAGVDCDTVHLTGFSVALERAVRRRVNSGRSVTQDV